MTAVLMNELMANAQVVDINESDGDCSDYL